MPREKGTPKTGGRQVGTTNKKTEQWKAFVDFCMTSGLEKFETELKALKGKEYIQAFTNLLEFHKPKLAKTELKGGLDVHQTGSIPITSWIKDQLDVED